MPPVRRPRRLLVSCHVPRHLCQFVRAEIHHVDIEISVRPPPTERQQLPVRRPVRVHHVPHVRQVHFFHARPVCVHQEELRQSAPSAHKRHLLSRFRVPHRRSVRTSRRGDPFQV